MEDRTRELITSSARIPTKPLDTQRLIRRGRKLRWRRRAIAACATVTVGVAAWSGGSQLIGNVESGDVQAPSARGSSSAGAPSGEEAEYSISNVSVTSESADNAQVEFVIAWQGEEFPGIRNCTAVVFGPNGEQLGSKTLDRVYKVHPDADRMAIDVQVTGTPSSAEVDCGTRVDDPKGRYVASEIDVKKANEGSQELLVTFNSVWTGDTSVPGIALCSVLVQDSAGSRLFTEEVSFSTEAQSVADVPLSLHMPAELTETPSSAEIDCVPMTVSRG